MSKFTKSVFGYDTFESAAKELRQVMLGDQVVEDPMQALGGLGEKKIADALVVDKKLEFDLYDKYCPDGSRPHLRNFLNEISANNDIFGEQRRSPSSKMRAKSLLQASFLVAGVSIAGVEFVQQDDLEKKAAEYRKNLYEFVIDSKEFDLCETNLTMDAVRMSHGEIQTLARGENTGQRELSKLALPTFEEVNQCADKAVEERMERNASTPDLTGILGGAFLLAAAGFSYSRRKSEAELDDSYRHVRLIGKRYRHNDLSG